MSSISNIQQFKGGKHVPQSTKPPTHLKNKSNLLRKTANSQSMVEEAIEDSLGMGGKKSNRGGDELSFDAASAKLAKQAVTNPQFSQS